MSMDAARTVPGRGPMFVFATVAVAIALYWPGAAALAELWTDARGDTYTHGFLIAALSVWLLWRRRAELTPESLPQPYRSMGLLALAGGVLIWLAPGITRAPPPLQGTVRLAAILLLAGFLVASFSAIPESVLRGMNVGYRRMGLREHRSRPGTARSPGRTGAHHGRQQAR